MNTTTQAVQRSHRLGRPRKARDELRSEELRLYLSHAEKQKLLDDAQAAGMRPAAYLRELIAGHQPAAMESRSIGNPKLLLELNAIGNNLNQVVRDMHAGSKRRHDWQQLQALLHQALQRVAFGDVC